MGEDFVKRMREKEQTQRMLVEAIDGLSAERKRVRMIFLKWASVFGLVAFALYMVFDSLVPSLGPIWADAKAKMGDLFASSSAPPPKALEETAMTKLNQALTNAPTKAAAEAAAKAQAQGQQTPAPATPTEAATTGQAQVPPGTPAPAPSSPQPAAAETAQAPPASAQPIAGQTQVSTPAPPVAAAAPGTPQPPLPAVSAAPTPVPPVTAAQPLAAHPAPAQPHALPLPGVQAIPLNVTALPVVPVDLTRFHVADEAQVRQASQWLQWLQAPAGHATAVPRTAYRDPASAGFRAPPPAVLPPAPRAPQLADYQSLPQLPPALQELEKNGQRGY